MKCASEKFRVRRSRRRSNMFYKVMIPFSYPLMPMETTLDNLVKKWVKKKSLSAEQDVLAFLETDEYAAMPYAQKNHPFVTSSKLKAYQECPYHAFLKYVELMDMGFETADHFIIGQAVDDLLTHGSVYFNQKYYPCDMRLKASKEFLAQHPEFIPLSLGDYAMIENMAKEYATRQFFPVKPIKKNIIWLMFEKIPCKAELDHFEEDSDLFEDTKTTASILTFDPNDYGLQMGFYYEGILEKLNQKRGAKLNVIDKHKNWTRSHSWIFSIPTLQSMQGEVHKLALEWHESMESEVWPHVDPSTWHGQKVCWNSEFYPVCPYCKVDVPTII